MSLLGCVDMNTAHLDIVLGNTGYGHSEAFTLVLYAYRNMNYLRRVYTNALYLITLQFAPHFEQLARINHGHEGLGIQ